MSRLILLFLALYTVSILAKTPEGTIKLINLGVHTQATVNKWIQDSLQTQSNSEKIKLLSHQFLSIPYVENTLIGSLQSPEQLTINFSGLDCFTFLDYIEAMRLSRSFDDFVQNVKVIRYKKNSVDYKNRSHFFSDWLEKKNIIDVTTKIANGVAVNKVIVLNKKNDHEQWVEGIPQKTKEVAFIPAGKINQEILGNIYTGDYFGIYADKPGLDVTHVGIAIWNNKTLYIRHASKKFKKVIDEPLLDYINDKPGLIVYRPRP